MGRDYPLGYQYFRTRCNRVFVKNSKEVNPEKIDLMIKHGEYIVKELEALYKLKKYRTLKRRYYNDDDDYIKQVMKKLNEESS